MAVIFKIPFIALAIFIILIIIYFTFLIFSQKSSRFLNKVPLFIEALNSRLDNIPVVSKTLGLYQQKLTLIYNSESYAELIATALAIIIPSLSILIIDLSILFINEWYFSLLISTFGIIIPYLQLTNLISNKHQRFQIKCIDLYEAANRFFSDDKNVLSAFELIADGTSGVVSEVASKFVQYYMYDSPKAFNYLVDTIGDKYAKRFSLCIAEYDESGEKPCNSIADIVNSARQHYNMIRRSNINAKATKEMCVYLIIIAIMCSIVTESTAASLGIHQTYPALSYLAIVGILLIYTLILFYERP